MGISVVSAASLNSPGKGAGPQQPTEASTADFAALLTQQISGASELVSMKLQAITGTELGMKAKDLLAEVKEDDSVKGQDAGALLAAAGLLPALLDPAKPNQAATDAALSGPEEQKAGQGQISGIIGQLSGRRESMDKDSLGNVARESSAVSAATDLRPEQTANIAVDSEAASGNGQNFAATLAAQTAMAHRSEPRPGEAAAAAIDTPLHDGRWGQEFGEKLVWLAKNDQQTAQLSINPPQLGPMHITLNLNGDQVSALFVSPHAEVREAIQDAMPQLREMLAGAGINLGQANVGTQLPQQNAGTQPQFSAPSPSADDKAILRAENGQGTGAPLTAVRGGRGMVDLFA